MSSLDDWVAAVSAELDLPEGLDTAAVLDLARDVAHAVLRPAPPVTTWLAGMAVAGGADASDVTARIRDLAESWEP